MKLNLFILKNIEVKIKIAIISFVSVSIIVFFTGCALMPKEETAITPPLNEPEKVTYNTVDVKRGTIEKRITATAYLVSSAQTNLSFQYRGGYLKAVYVKTGNTVRTNHNDIKTDDSIKGRDDGKQDVTVKKGDVLAELDTGDLENEISMQKLVLSKALLVLEKLKTEYEINCGGDKYDLKQAEIDVDLAKLKLSDLQMELEKSKIISPVSGIVDYIDESQDGEYISANKTFIRIVDPSQLLVESSQDGVAALKFGMKVDVEIKGKALKGEIVMAPYDITATDYEKARDFGKEQDYLKVIEKLQNTVRIKAEDLPADSVIGDQARISASLDKKDGVLIIPKNVVHTFENRKFVKVLRNGISEDEDIETGIETATEYEAIKGLQDGDKVIK